MKNKKIIIITSFGKRIGMGHYYRGEKIKKILIDRYYVKHFAFKNEKLNLEKFNYLTQEKNKNKYLLIIDIKNFEKKTFLNKIKKFKNKKIGIDPPSKVFKLLNLAWYPGIVKKKNLKFRKNFSGKNSILPNGKLDNEIIGESNSILFFTGGSDLHKMSDYLPNQLSSIDKKYKKIWIKGEYSKKPKIKNKKKNNWQIISNKKNFYSKKIKAKIAFCIFGTTFFELAFKGIPTVVHDQYNTAERLKDLKTLETLNLVIWAKKKSEIAKKINLLLSDKSKYQVISNNLRKYFSEKNNRNTILKKIKSIF